MKQHSIVMSNRRTFLASAGSVVGWAAIPGAAFAKRRGKGKKKGIKKQVADYIEDFENDKAEKLLKKHEIPYNRQKVGVKPKVGEVSNDGISTQDRYENPDTGSGWVDFLNYQHGGNTWDFYWSWELKDTDFWSPDGTPPNDAAVIAWDESQWGLTDLDDVSKSIILFKNNGSETINPDLAGGGLIGNYNNGIGITYDDGSGPYPYPKLAGNLGVRLAQQGFPDRTPGRVETLLQHTWSIGGGAEWDFINSVSITSSGGIGVSVPVYADSWDNPPRRDVRL